MNKVKEIFSNKDSSSENVHSGTTTSQGARDRSGVDGYTSGATAGHTSGVTGSTGTTGSNVESGRVSSQPTLPGHKHNIDRNADIEHATGDKTHDHKHLAAVTKEHHRTHETEEVIRERDVDKHIHHVQHHVQPVLDTQHTEHEHASRVHPNTEIREQHVNTAEDKKLFAGLNVHQNEQHHGGKDRTVVDKGEVVHENLHHHVHHVVQPVIERDVHHHNTVHTTIPVKQVTHEAPIIHQSSTHEPMQVKDFLAQGGDLSSKLTHDQAGVLAEGECAREVTGPGEKLIQELGIGSHSGRGSTTTGGGSSGFTGSTGNTGSNLGSETANSSRIPGQEPSTGHNGATGTRI